MAEVEAQDKNVDSGLRIYTVKLSKGVKAVNMVWHSAEQVAEILLSPEQAMSVGIALVKAGHLADTSQPGRTDSVIH
ncbi:hypothetical protein HZU77_013515 [Neisseriaceae bacterium TC5R-5]|nr:hypothetical protein [Neisseriaceae bacterium TC5R-5]